MLKKSNRVKVSDYVKACNLVVELSFAWWVSYTLCWRERIIASIKSWILKKTHKYGIEIPRDLSHAHELDQTNENTLSMDAYDAQMREISVDFEILENGQKTPPMWKWSNRHLFFDVKIDFTRNNLWVKSRHKTSNPEISSYAGVISRESIQIALTYAALHGINIMSGDMQSVYLQMPLSEKNYIICGKEFELKHIRKVALIWRVLYEGKVICRDFWMRRRRFMDMLGFKCSLVDSNIWMRMSKQNDGSEYYEYVLFYVEYVLEISDNAEQIIQKDIGRFIQFKKKFIGVLTQYLVRKFWKVNLKNGTNAWAFGSNQYVWEAAKNVESYLKTKERGLFNKIQTPLSPGYCLETDITLEIPLTEISYFHSLIRMLQWIVEFGRVDICVETSMITSHLALPCVRHLGETFHIFSYLKAHPNAEIIFDPS